MLNKCENDGDCLTCPAYEDCEDRAIDNTDNDSEQIGCENID